MNGCELRALLLRWKAVQRLAKPNCSTLLLKQIENLTFLRARWRHRDLKKHGIHWKRKGNVQTRRSAPRGTQLFNMAPKPYQNHGILHLRRRGKHSGSVKSIYETNGFRNLAARTPRHLAAAQRSECC